MLDATINADSGASNLFVDPDEQYVVFGAVRPEGRGGVDLYVSWRRNGSWSAPRNLGPLVNSSDTEFCPFVSRDGRYLYFTRVDAPPVRRRAAISTSFGSTRSSRRSNPDRKTRTYAW